jgi:hypothetical protein
VEALQAGRGTGFGLEGLAARFRRLDQRYEQTVLIIAQDLPAAKIFR